MNDLVVSYQMGKVGSSSIVASIPGCKQFHSWSSEEPIMFFSSRNTGSGLGRFKQYFKWKLAYRNLSKLVGRAKENNGRIKLIIGVREPVSRNISGYFQSLMSREEGVDLSLLMDMFYAYCPHLCSVKWFDVELRQRLGIDVYSYPFDVGNGWTSFSDGIYDVFLYRQENLRGLSKELGDFLNIPDFKLVAVNEGGEKWSGDLYSDFLKSFTPSEEYLDLLYNTEYFRHFYGDAYKEEMERKWLIR
ncbi:putative capsular polysaccharide synthesis family protein [Thalassolituus oleivorans]|uniref:Sulfotransferase family protein n=1 Tax=Thalassolituus oleivorans MIL-1 TaxID=1298593 RepID=M5DST2_9GAMM|nr:putative capsular polysaccharide synthesis family protein [Thalassolituus oleivorans]CCU72971.1 hypothetical protein TOL_2572 [Thalassolituus oleivorans MIL-1]